MKGTSAGWRPILVRVAATLLAVAAIALLARAGAFDALTLGSLKARQAALAAAYGERPLGFAAAYLAIYVTLTALCVPVATLLSVAGGAVFGPAVGIPLASFGVALGATGTMLGSRFLFREAARARFRSACERFDRGIEREGASYLLAMRLVLAVPFLAINVGMGVTRIRTWTFYWVTQAGTLPVTIAYVLAGTELAHVDSLRGIISLKLVLPIAALALLPLLMKRMLRSRPSAH